MVPCRFNLDLPFLDLALSSKGHGSNLWLSSNIRLFYFIGTWLGHSFKVISLGLVMHACKLTCATCHNMLFAMCRYIIPLNQNYVIKNSSRDPKKWTCGQENSQQVKWQTSRYILYTYIIVWGFVKEVIYCRAKPLVEAITWHKHPLEAPFKDR
jgi:hypothetical protein